MAGQALLDLVYAEDLRDRSWKRRALCMQHHPGIPPTAWTVDEKKRVMIAGVSVPAVRAHEMAAMICFSCPAQYDCLRFALDGDEACGVWAMTPRDMKRFRDTTRVLGLSPVATVDYAEGNGVPVQVMVRQLVAQV